MVKMVEKRLVDSIPPVSRKKSWLIEFLTWFLSMLPIKILGTIYSSSNSRPQPYQIYRENVDTSRVPRIFQKYYDDEDGDGIYMYPQNDEELLEWTWRPLNRVCSEIYKHPKVYHVEVNADSCTVQDCLKLLKKIACENRFIACSVQRARLFFAELNKDEAAKLECLKGIRSVYLRWDPDLLRDI